MSKYDSAMELAGKVSWEGGAVDFITAYGVRISDLPDDLPDSVRTAFMHLIHSPEIWASVSVIEEWVEETFDV